MGKGVRFNSDEKGDGHSLIPDGPFEGLYGQETDEELEEHELEANRLVRAFTRRGHHVSTQPNSDGISCIRP